MAKETKKIDPIEELFKGTDAEPVSVVDMAKHLRDRLPAKERPGFIKRIAGKIAEAKRDTAYRDLLQNAPMRFFEGLVSSAITRDGDATSNEKMRKTTRMARDFVNELDDNENDE